jgi:RND superfamily putative drug exporter
MSIQRRLEQAVGFPVRHPWLTLLGWLCLAAVVNIAARAVTAPAPAPSFLPSRAESQRAQQIENAKFTAPRPSAQLILEDRNGVQPADQELMANLGSWLQSAQGPGDVSSVTPVQSSLDGKALLAQVTFASSGSQLNQSVAMIEGHLAGLNVAAGTGVALTGAPAIDHDLTAGIVDQGSSGSFSTSRGLILLLVVLVLALVYRAPLAVFVPLGSIAVVLATSPQLVTLAAARFGLPLSDYSLPFVFAVTLGAGTNYGLFLMSRYREELRLGGDRKRRLNAANIAVAAAITSSAATVVLATGSMGLATLGFFNTLGPAVAISVALMLLAGLTLTPALMAIAGRALFWPWRPRAASDGRLPGSSLWRLVSETVIRRPRLVAALTLVLLLPPVLGLTRLQISFDNVRSLPNGAPAVAGYRMLRAHFGDVAAENFIYLHAVRRLNADSPVLAAVRESIHSTPGVASAGQPMLSADGTTARYVLRLHADPSSSEAAAALGSAEESARKTASRAAPGTRVEVLAGGATATDRDLRQLLGRDFLLLALLVSGAIFLVLVLLLHNLLAPVYLLASVGLSTAAAIGLTAFGYGHWAQTPLFWTAPVFAFVFLIALGEDFNIYLVTRLREATAENRSSEAAIGEAVTRTGGVISSAGIVMAAAFSLLVRNPVLLVQQIGVVVVAGVLLDTFIVRPLLVPALVTLLGRRSGFSPARVQGPCDENTLRRRTATYLRGVWP